MSGSAFLDTTVCLGFCFTVDIHHKKCQKYIQNNNFSFYISDIIEEEYKKKKSALNTRYSTAITRHIGDLRRSNLSGELGPMDLSKVKNQILHRNNDAFDFLCRYYDDEVGPFIQMDRLLKELSDLSRDIDKLAQSRKAQLDSLAQQWTMREEHSDIKEKLKEIHEPDRTICLESHDLALHEGDPYTELATANSTDLIDNGRKDLIIDNTEINDVRDLSP